jgi:hypothetical protein
MHISSSFNVPQYVVDKLETQTFKLQQSQAYKTSLRSTITDYPFTNLQFLFIDDGYTVTCVI